MYEGFFSLSSFHLLLFLCIDKATKKKEKEVSSICIKFKACVAKVQTMASIEKAQYINA